MSRVQRVVERNKGGYESPTGNKEATEVEEAQMFVAASLQGGAALRNDIDIAPGHAGLQVRK